MTTRLHEVFAQDDSAPNVDMSPMIDLVFLLLIFFIVSAQMVDLRTDEAVVPPVADSAKKAEDGMMGRLVINVRQDDSIRDEKAQEISIDQVTTLAAEHIRKCRELGIPPKLFLRFDHRASMERMKNINRAAAQAGLSTVIFSSYAVDPGNAP